MRLFSLVLIATILTVSTAAAQNYQLIYTGRCSDNAGCAPITTADTCTAAAKTLGVPITSDSAFVSERANEPRQCRIHWNGGLLFNNVSRYETCSNGHCICSCDNGVALPKVCGEGTICDDCECCINSFGTFARYCESGYKCSDDNTSCVRQSSAWWIWLIVAIICVGVIAGIAGCVFCCCTGRCCCGPQREQTEVKSIQGVAVVPVEPKEEICSE